ncbi:hypothetical protein Tco_0431816 [Tanacetum coccineum]
MWESEELIRNMIDWNKPPKGRDGAWHVKIRLIDPDGEEFTKTFKSIPTTRKLSEKENPSEIIDLHHFHDSYECELEAWIFDVALESLHQFFMVMQLWDNYYFEFRKSTNAPDIFPARHILGGYSSPKRVHFINTITILSKEDELGETKIVKQDTKDNDHESIVKVEEKILPSSNTQFVCTKENDEDVMFVELIKKYNDSSEEELEFNENAVTEEELGVEYFDRFPTISELAYHKYLMCAPIPSLFLRNPIIVGGNPSNLKIPCNIGHAHIEKACIDLNSHINVLTHFMIVEDISSIIDLRLSQVVLGKPFVEVSNMTHDSSIGVEKFTIEDN